MTQQHEIKENIERMILVAVEVPGSPFPAEESLDELEELARTAGAVVVGKVIQKLERFNPSTYMGKGKIDEVKELVWETDATGIITDDELSPAQINNLSDAFEVKVMDRTMLILDIFVNRATTREGMLQVELAQLRYSLNRLTGMGKSLSRQGGGIGTRGPGEKKLETDRRHVRDRIALLNRELKHIKQHRDLIREKRKDNVAIVTLVGYTNAGKSTILNTLTGADVLAENKLFATLDPTSRGWTLSNGKEIVLTDTVGFINKLPHHLTKAFHSTLEEAVFADLLLHVIDSSSNHMEMQLEVVHNTLSHLGVDDYPTVTVFNKIDIEEPYIKPTRYEPEAIVKISATNGKGLDELEQVIIDFFQKQSTEINIVIPYNNGQVLEQIRTKGQLISEEYVEDGIQIKAYVNAALLGQIEKQLGCKIN